MDDDINMVAIRSEDIRVEFNRDFKEIIDLKLKPYRYKN
ncbi:iron ABC transporter ATP-binding protein [Clostridioides difficile]|nr:iron ABC transporter ATP-binding protein [Clostridioides difficile]MCK3712567.1 iron ABC transporter ATP-binding protein [Clostridioides difficile]VHX76391.1 iron ABC transporter ATP-binding protein [Clostridioides difficile]HEL5661100.1 iron ABC transporter ATP-binding protein [Clostridioides difficile]